MQPAHFPPNWRPPNRTFGQTKRLGRLGELGPLRALRNKRLQPVEQATSAARNRWLWAAVTLLFGELERTWANLSDAQTIDRRREKLSLCAPSPLRNRCSLCPAGAQNPRLTAENPLQSAGA